MNKKLIPFSGGLDSTYLAWLSLAYGHKIKLIYVETGTYSLAKRIIEKQQCLKICNTLLNSYGSKVEFEVVHLRDFDSMDLFNWFREACRITMSKDNEITEINFGYISDDIEGNTEKMPKRLSKLKEMFPNLKIDFPLLETTKANIIKTLPSYLLKDVFSCEAPIFKNTKIGTEVKVCGKCNPCEDGKKWKAHSKKTKKFLLDIKLNQEEIDSCNFDHRIALYDSKGIGAVEEVYGNKDMMKNPILLETVKRLKNTL